MEFIIANKDVIVTLIGMIVTWVLGFLAKKSPYINNNLIIIQNIVVGLVVSGLYYLITKDFNMAITLSGLFAETGYNLFHNIEKLIDEQKNANSEMNSTDVTKYKQS